MSRCLLPAESCFTYTSTFRLRCPPQSSIRSGQASRKSSGYRAKHSPASLVSCTATASPTAQGQQLKTADEAAWDDKYSSFGNLAHGESLIQGRRESMEDTAVVIPKARCGYLFAAVFDGHSGSQSAQYLSKELYKAFSGAIDDNSYSEECVIDDVDVTGLCCPLEFSGVLRQSFADMDAELLQWLQDNTEGEERESGSTATVVLARKDKLVIANVGDSRAVLSRSGKPIDLSAEHRVSGKSDVMRSEVTRVEAAGGWVQDGRVCDLIAVSRAFGDRYFKHPDVNQLAHKSVKGGLWKPELLEKAKFTKDLIICQPDVTEIALADGDEFVILATDGLWDVLSSKDAIKIAKDAFQKQRSPEEIATLLTERAYRKYSYDNIAAIVIDLGGPPGGWKESKPTGGLRGLFR